MYVMQYSKEEILLTGKDDLNIMFYSFLTYFVLKN
jgi:hypothetical protein